MRRIAKREESFERHTAIKLERVGDPRYPHRKVEPDGRISHDLNPEGPATIKQQLQRFREEFGRDPEPHEPLFFKNVDGEPVEVTQDDLATDMRAFARTIKEPRIRAWFFAMVDTGYSPTEANRHTHAAMELEEFAVSVERHLPQDLRGQAESIDDYIAPISISDLLNDGAGSLEND